MSIMTQGYGTGAEECPPPDTPTRRGSTGNRNISGCHFVHSGYSSGAGYIEEDECGITPPVCVDIELSFPSGFIELNDLYPPSEHIFKYAITRDNCENRTRLWFSHYNDSGVAVWVQISNGGAATITANGTIYTSVLNPIYDEGRFYPFGYLTSFVPNYDISNTEFRSIESDEVECMLDGHHGTQINLSYYPSNTRRLYYTLGIALYDLTGLTAPIDIGRCLPYQSIFNWHNEECNSIDEINFLYNMSKVRSFTINADMNGFVEWNEILVAQKEQYSYDNTFDDVAVGEYTTLPCCDPYMFYEGDIWITRYLEEDASDQLVTPGQTIFAVSHSVFDFNRDGYIDNTEVDCFWDIKVFVNDIEVDIEYVTFNTVELVEGLNIGDNVVIKYHYIEQIYNCTSYSMTVDWGTTPLSTFNTIYPQDMVERGLSITGTLTMNFENLKEYVQYVNSQFYHIFFEQGGEVVFECLWCKWDGMKRNIAEDDLISAILPFTASKLQIDNQIRRGSLRELEEEIIEPEPTPTPPVVYGFPIFNGFED